jgi:hypothetical protein
VQAGEFGTDEPVGLQEAGLRVAKERRLEGGRREKGGSELEPTALTGLKRNTLRAVEGVEAQKTPWASLAFHATSVSKYSLIATTLPVSAEKVITSIALHRQTPGTSAHLSLKEHSHGEESGLLVVVLARLERLRVSVALDVRSVSDHSRPAMTNSSTHRMQSYRENGECSRRSCRR